MEYKNVQEIFPGIGCAWTNADGKATAEYYGVAGSDVAFRDCLADRVGMGAVGFLRQGEADDSVSPCQSVIGTSALIQKYAVSAVLG